ncbi:MAG: adaptor protein MecA [Clostridia bacterium]|nr:adaptor protein MecA [Clostridia bacterium]
MEYIMISESKLKVMLEEDDLESRNLEAEDLDYADPDAKKLFGDILCYAKDNFGFDTSGHRVLLQLYPAKDGGCELFITKLGKLEKESSAQNEYEKKKRASPRDKKSKNDRAFKFDRLSHLLKVCKRLYENSVECSGSVYRDPEGVWFLLLSFEDSLYDEIYDVLPINDLSFISEYGSAENPHTLSLYLSEHATEIRSGDAIEVLGKL